jgi:hypothetical protein
MMLADTMAIFFVVIGLLLAFPGLWLTCRGLWPAVVETGSLVCEKSLWRPFFLGLPITGFVVFLFSILSSKKGGPGEFLALVMLSIFVFYTFLGTAGLANLIGRRLNSPWDFARPWLPVLCGGIVLELAYLFPIVGWFLILPVTLVIGCGAATISIWRLAKAPGAGKNSQTSEAR